jgi:hypothetical protein
MTDTAAALPHLTAEFFVWLWFASEREGGTMDVGQDVGLIDFWIDERLSFRSPDEDKPRAVLTGENTSTSAEARAALASGKVVRDLQLHLRREEREYSVTLRGANLDVCGLKFPQHAVDGEDELLYERMFLYEDVWTVIRALYRRFAKERVSGAWHRDVLPAIREFAATGALPDRDIKAEAGAYVRGNEE